jgi:hypothetical protein
VVQSQHRNILRDNQLYFNSLVPQPSAANQLPILTSAVAGTWGKAGTGSFLGGGLTTASLADGAVTTAKLLDGGVDSTALAPSATDALFPARLVLFVRTAAEIAPGWTRETALDGRLLINAGGGFGEASDYGSSWSHAHSWSLGTGGPSATQTSIATITPQEVPAASAGHGHSASGTAENAAWTIPSRGVVWMRKTP